MIGIDDTVIDPRAVEEAVWAPADGAVVTFTGIVRDHDGGREVTELEYSAHPGAERMLASLCAEIAGDELRVAAVHRVGRLRVGDVAVAVSVASPHREEAFDACRTLIDRLKHEIPIWKRQHFATGSSEWVGVGDC